MRLVARILISIWCVSLVACGGSGSSDGDDGTGDQDQLEPDILQGLSGITGLRFSVPAGFTYIPASDGEFAFQAGTYEYQVGGTVANADNTIVCATASELAPASITASTARAQVVSSYAGNIVSVEDINNSGISGQEVILNSTNSSGLDITRIARHYYVPADRLFLSTDDIAIFFVSCSTAAVNYSDNEPTMRGFLDTVSFTTVTP